MVAIVFVGGVSLDTGERDRLAFVVQVGMRCDLKVVVVQVLEHDRRCAGQSGTVEREGHFHLTVSRLGREGCFGGNFLAVCQ